MEKTMKSYAYAMLAVIDNLGQDRKWLTPA